MARPKARNVAVFASALMLGGFTIGLGVASASSSIAAPVTVKVIEHSLHDKVIDVGKPGDSTGDILTFHNDLYDSSDTNKVGVDQGQCTRMNPKAGTWECWWSIVLEDGQVTAEGPYSDTAPTDLYAVTGGTGAYENVGGSVLEESGPGASEYTLTYNLVP